MGSGRPCGSGPATAQPPSWRPSGGRPGPTSALQERRRWSEHMLTLPLSQPGHRSPTLLRKRVPESRSASLTWSQHLTACGRQPDLWARRSSPPPRPAPRPLLWAPPCGHPLSPQLQERLGTPRSTARAPALPLSLPSSLSLPTVCLLRPLPQGQRPHPAVSGSPARAHGLAHGGAPHRPPPLACRGGIGGTGLWPARGGVPARAVQRYVTPYSGSFPSFK